MKLTQHQEQLYDAVTGIDEKLVAEALAAPRAKRNLVKRIAAVAALFAIIIGSIALLNSLDNDPIFSLSVQADDDLDTTITITADAVPEYAANSGHVKDSLSETWHNYDLFSIKIGMYNVTREYLESTYVTVNYAGEEITAAAETPQLNVRYPEIASQSNATESTICEIYGWATDLTDGRLEFTVSIYHREDGQEVLLYKQPFDIYYDSGLLGINGKFNKSSDDISWSVNLMSTEELVNVIAEDENPPMYHVQSNLDPMNTNQLTRSHYADILAVLDTRDDAAQAILNQFQEFDQMNIEELKADLICNMERVIALTNLLEVDYYDQLTVDEFALFETYRESIVEKLYME